MRKIFIYSLLGLMLGVALVALIEIDPGYVLVAYGNYTVETSLWVGTLVLLLFTGLVYLLIRLIRKILVEICAPQASLRRNFSRQGFFESGE